MGLFQIFKEFSRVMNFYRTAMSGQISAFGSPKWFSESNISKLTPAFKAWFWRADFVVEKGFSRGGLPVQWIWKADFVVGERRNGFSRQRPAFKQWFSKELGLPKTVFEAEVWVGCLLPLFRSLGAVPAWYLSVVRFPCFLSPFLSFGAVRAWYLSVVVWLLLALVVRSILAVLLREMVFGRFCDWLPLYLCTASVLFLYVYSLAGPSFCWQN